MKHLLVLLILLNRIILSAQPQTEPFKKANIILIETSLEGKQAFTLWGKHLGQNGFSIDKSDETFYTLTTEIKDTKKFNVEYFLICAISDNGIIKIRIKWRVPPSTLIKSQRTDFFDWEYSASKSTTTNSIFVDVEKIINSFGHYMVRYEKE